jgi:alanyl-tRNA synthetase
VPTSNEIREQFLDFFRKRGHEIVPGSPVVPHDDPTLLFTNAGMNQFKDVFLGTGTRPYKRAADTQKCIRAGGKHNDLDDVGRDTYHHTFFEMLGNWSFGDYFKKEAIAWAWELLTQVWKLDKSRLHVTVFEGDPGNNIARDDEAHQLWRDAAGVEPAHIHFGGKKDNFWEMGETGPCGPCTEIHYDKTSDRSGRHLVNKGDPRVIEIWNLVFIQFNRAADGKLTPLPARHVDTGMGFERICAVLQGKESNYDTTVFEPLIQAIGQIAGKTYGGSLIDPNDIAFRVIADHARAAIFAITDGAEPSNKGRGAVLRSIIRRAVRYGYQELNLREPFLHKLVPVLSDQLGGVFPELKGKPGKVVDSLRAEEADFLKVIDRGLKMFEDVCSRAGAAGGKIGGDDLFTLHATHGFPADMAAQIARERGLSPDIDGFEQHRRHHEAVSRGDAGGPAVEAVSLEGLDKVPPTEFVGYAHTSIPDARIVGLWNKAGRHIERAVSHAPAGEAADHLTCAVALDRSPFYVEGGGQVGDVGTIWNHQGRMQVEKVVRVQGAEGPILVHYGRIEDGVLQAGAMRGGAAPHDRYTAEVDPRRVDTMRNHTATHLLNWALRKVLGDGVHQKSSLVDAEKTRFGFSHDKPLTAAETAEVERLVNERVAADLPVTFKYLPLTDARKIAGLRAVFGEKYPDPVRVLMIGVEDPAEATMEHSVELCGGTHCTHTGQIGFFKIVSEEPEGKGVRRVTAVTGRGAVEHVQRMESVLSELAEKLKVGTAELPARVEALQNQVKELDRQLRKGAAAGLTDTADQLLEKAEAVGEGKLIVGELPAAGDDQVRNAIDRIRKKAGVCAVFVGCRDEGKVTLYAAASPELVKKGLHAGNAIKEAAAVVGGRGGGKPEGIAQGGGNLPDRLAEALDKARQMFKKAMSG